MTHTILFIHLDFPVWDPKSVREYCMHKLFACLYCSCFRNRNFVSYIGFRIAAPSGIKTMREQSPSHWKAHSLLLSAAAGDNAELWWEGSSLKRLKGEKVLKRKRWAQTPKITAFIWVGICFLNLISKLKHNGMFCLQGNNTTQNYLQ